MKRIKQPLKSALPVGTFLFIPFKIYCLKSEQVTRNGIVDPTFIISLMTVTFNTT
jgi:hypothetical protein